MEYWGDGYWDEYEDVFYYITNVQGDVVAIVDSDGYVMVQYDYDAWGKPIRTQYADETASTYITYFNPLRYRGYVYDQETGLYYLQSRYYDPEIGRFINADAYASTGQGLLGNNTFAYCYNNSVNAVDPFGEDAIWLQDKNDVFGFGHTGLLIQDENGVWYHFYWGYSGTSKIMKSGADCGIRALNDGTYTDIDTINENLNGIYGGKYDGMIYFKGDFSACVDYAKNLKSNYNLLFNNCMQVSVDVLLRGEFEQSDLCYKTFLLKIRQNPIPNIAFKRLHIFHNSVSRFHSAPWYLKIFYTTPMKAVILF